MRGMMGMREIRVEMQGMREIRVGMQGMWGIRVGMQGMRKSSGNVGNAGNQGGNAGNITEIGETKLKFIKSNSLFLLKLKKRKKLELSQNNNICFMKLET